MFPDACFGPFLVTFYIPFAQMTVSIDVPQNYPHPSQYKFHSISALNYVLTTS